MTFSPDNPEQEQPASPPDDEKQKTKVPLNALDYTCRNGPIRALILIIGLVFLYPRLMSCCRPSGEATLFFFLFFNWLLFAELYAFYYHTFKRRNLMQWFFTLFLLPLEYGLYSILCSLFEGTIH